MRKVIALRAMDAADRDEQQALIDTYWHALTTIDRVEARVEAGEPVTRATEGEGYSRATYYRVSQRRTEATNETVEGPDAPAGQSEEINPKSKPAYILPLPDAWKEIISARDAADAAVAAEVARIDAEKEADRERRRAERERLAEENRRIDADDLEPPPALKRLKPSRQPEAA